MEGKGIKEKSILPDEGSLISPLEKSTTLQKTKIKNHGVGQGGQERTTSDGVLPPKFWFLFPSLNIKRCASDETWKLCGSCCVAQWVCGRQGRCFRRAASRWWRKWRTASPSTSSRTEGPAASKEQTKKTLETLSNRNENPIWSTVSWFLWDHTRAQGDFNWMGLYKNSYNKMFSLMH